MKQPPGLTLQKTHAHLHAPLLKTASVEPRRNLRFTGKGCGGSLHRWNLLFQTMQVRLPGCYFTNTDIVKDMTFRYLNSARRGTRQRMASILGVEVMWRTCRGDLQKTFWGPSGVSVMRCEDRKWLWGRVFPDLRCRQDTRADHHILVETNVLPSGRRGIGPANNF